MGIMWIQQGGFSIYISCEGSWSRDTDKRHDILMSLQSLVEKNKGIGIILKLSLYVWEMKFSATFSQLSENK